MLLTLEANRNLVRLARLGHLAPLDLSRCLDRLREDTELFLLRDLTLDLCIQREMPTLSTPRSPDLAHLRTALWFHRQSPLARFVTLDESQEQAAREMDLPVGV